MRRGRPGQGGSLRDSITAHSGVMASLYEPRITNHEPLLFSDSDAATPRQTQTNNDASGSPPRVAGRPPRLFVLETVLPLPMVGTWRAGTAPTVSQAMNDERPTMNE